MRFERLRLSGFKSFVDPTEFRIEPGLTGVVGPNGCGKSNLLEALRWVMGAASAKAMRAEGMDDVIFGGASGRPPRNHAEVLLTIDNAQRKAPAPFNDHPVLEITRRIDRGQGSTYRVNGVETRARDIQLLFADASTGANSPALVRQGQISELIAAKPSNRRRVLEEAAGVSGLHGRRHEADLRLKAAEANLARLDDVARELETALAALRRQARQAETYRRLSAEIRSLQGIAVYARWSEANTALGLAEAERAETDRAVEDTTREAAAAGTRALQANEALKPLREEAAVAQALLQRLMIEQDRIEREAAQAEAEVARIEAERARIDADAAREAQMGEDAEAALAKLTAEAEALDREIAAAPERTPELEAALAAAGEARAAAEAEVERLATEAAAAAARARAAADQLAEAEAAARAGHARREEAQHRLNRTLRALDAAKADRAAIGSGPDPAADAAKARLAAAEAALGDARAALEAAEGRRATAQAVEAAARDAARTAEDQLRRASAEADGLAALTKPRPGAAFRPVLDDIRPERGYEAALAAALGEDLDGALDDKAPMRWAGANAPTAVPWPLGARPLAPLVKAPPALAARLAMTALVDRIDGPRLQGVLPVGARLVSREGDLWRWDGFTVRAEAEPPAAKRLAQRARLDEVRAAIETLKPAAATAAAEHQAARQALSAAEAAVGSARSAPLQAERALGQARDEAERLARDAARREARAQALDQTVASFEGEAEAARAALVVAETEAAEVQARYDALRGAAPFSLAPDPGGALAAARAVAGERREQEARARAARDYETRAREQRIARRAALERETADWRKRAQAAKTRIDALAGERAKAIEALDQAREAPKAVGARKQDLMDDLAIAEARRAKASDALTDAESGQAAADRALRAAEARQAEARERRAGALARHEGAAERLETAAEQLRAATKMEPEALGRQILEEREAKGGDADPTSLEARLVRLEAQREAMGPVNLRADEEAEEQALRLEAMRAERADLAGAITRLRAGIEELNAEGRERLLAAFEVIHEGFKALFQTLFEGGQAELKLVESEDPLEAGLEIYACPPGKRLAAMSLMSGGEQALTATALIFGVFLANPAPICVLDEVDAPLDDANVDRFCRMLDEMRKRTDTRFIAITHNPVTMSRMDRLFGVTMAERGVSQLVSVDLVEAAALAAQ